MAHTEGEWETENNITAPLMNYDNCTVVFCKNAPVAIITDNWIPDGMNEANAKLIAQAPKLLKRSIDLLDSILSIHQYNKGVCTERDIKRINKMQEAINKATK